MRGEKIPALAAFISSVGSPPHARGKGGHHRIQRMVIRITPACAGKRMEEATETAYEEDHPRMRGEKTASSSSKNAA